MSTWNPKANEIFLHALELPTPGEREEFLNRACHGDAALKAEVEALLEAGAQAGSFLESPAIASKLAATIDQAIIERPGTAIGPYKLLEQIGEGGFGVVFMAEQHQPVRRKVALKMLKPGMDTRQVVARFEAERQALALMDHPNIAHVFDGGTTAAGRPYFVMDLVKGIPITEYCDQNQIAPRERLELFVQVCEAVQHAHQKGIIHRDIKPSNVLISRHDGTPVVKVIDFGIAKALGQQLTEKTLFTNFAQLIGTPLYMSPEQAGMSDLDVDTRSDIYSLGVLLYELLTGTTPFDAYRFKDAGFDEMRRIIREEEPPKPSTRISTLGQAASTVSTRRKSDPKRLSQIIRGELDWIAMKCLEKDRNRRYETANGLAMDVQRYLRDEPVLACPPSAWYRFRKFARRKKVALAMAACVLLALSGIAGGVGWAVRDKRARDDAGELDRLAREKALDHLVERNLDETEPLIEEGRWPEALAIIERTEQLLDAAGRTERPAQLVELRRALAVVQRLEGIYQGPLHGVRQRRRLVSNPDGTKYEDPAPQDIYDEAFFWGRQQDADFTKVFRDLGIDVETLSVAEAAEKIRRQSIRTALVRALDGWASFRKRSLDVRWRGAANSDWKKLIEIARQADADGLRNRCRDALLKEDRQALVELADAVPVRQTPSESLYLLGQALKEVGAVDMAMTFLERSRREYPGELWLNDALADFSISACQPPRWDDVLRYSSAVLALRPDFSPIHLRVADALKAKGAADEALLEYSKAIELEPKSVVTWTIRGNFFRSLRRYEEAIADYSKAVELEPTNFSASDARIGALLDAGQYDKALADATRAVKMVQERIDMGGAEPNLRVELGHSLWHLARVLSSTSKDAEAEKALHEALKVFENLASEYPQDRYFRLETAYTLRQLFYDVWRGANRTDEALEAMRRAIDLYAALVAEEPRDEFPRSEVAITCNDLAHYLNAHERSSEAVRYFQQALDARRTLAAETPTSERRFELALTLNSLASHYRDAHRLSEAEESFREALEICRKLVSETDFPGGAPWSMGDGCCLLAGILRTTGRSQEADELCRQVAHECRSAMAIQKQLVRARNLSGDRFDLAGTLESLALLLMELNEVQEAEHCFRDAIDVRQKLVADFNTEPDRSCLAFNYDRLGQLLRRHGRADEAVEPYRAAHAIWEKLVAELNHEDHRRHLGETNQVVGELAEAAGQFDDAAEANREAAEVWQKLVNDFPSKVEYRQNLATSYGRLAATLNGDGRPAEAMNSWNQAASIAEELVRDFPDEPRYARELNTIHGDLAANFIRAGRFPDGDKFYSENIKLKPNDAMLWLRRAEFYSQLGLWDLAARDSIEAFKLQPRATPRHCLAYALLVLFAGDRALYRQLCEFLPARIRPESNYGGDENELARACGLAAAPDMDLHWAVERAERGLKAEPNTPWTQYALALVRFRAGELQQAITLFERSLQTDANWRSGGLNYAVLAMAHHQLGNTEKAKESLEKARRVIDQGSDVVARGPVGAMPMPWFDWLELCLLYREAKTLIDGSAPADDARWLIARGRGLEAIGRTDEARATFAQAFALSPDDLTIRIQALPDINRADAYALALADLRVFLKEHPQQPLAARLALAQRELQWGDRQAQAGQFQAAAEPFARAAAGFETVIAELLMKADATTADVPATAKDIAWYRHELGYALVWNGYLLSQRGQLPEAEAALKRGLEVHESLMADAEAPSDTKARLSWNRFELGRVFQARSLPREAEHEYREVIAFMEGQGKADDSLVGSCEALAQICEVEGRTAEAIEAQRTAVTACEQLATGASNLHNRTRQARANWRLAALLVRAQEKPAAREAYDKAVAIFATILQEHPDRADLYVSCALLRCEFATSQSGAGDTDQASSDTDQASSQFREAIAAYTKVIELAPDNAVAHNNLAWLYATCPETELRDPAKAVALAKRAVELRPVDGTSWNTLGAAQYRARDWQAAVEALTKSMELRSGGDAEDWYFLAMAHWQLGQHDDARKWQQQAIEWEEKNAATLSANRQTADELHRFREEAEELLQSK